MSANETAEAILIVLKRIGKWILIAVGIVVVAILISVLYPEFDNYLENRPRVVTQFKGISIGEKLSDFLFRNSGFTEDKLESKRADEDTRYQNKETSLRVGIKDSLVVRVTYICRNDYEYTSVNGIKCNSIGDGIIEKFGKDVRVLCLKDKSDKMYSSYRVYDVVKYGVRHHVFSNYVKAIDVNKISKLSEYGPSWEDCE